MPTTLAPPRTTASLTSRNAALADRLLQGADALRQFATTLSDAEWRAPVTGDGRSVGVIVHHVASVYPIEIELARTIATGTAITDVSMNDIHAMNAAHAEANRDVTREQALSLLVANSAAAAEAIRRFSDDELALAAPASLYGGAPMTTQFVLEDHAVRHSFHHLARIRATLGR